MLHEKRNFTIYQDYENAHGLRKTVGVKIPIDAVEVEEYQSRRRRKGRVDGCYRNGAWKDDIVENTLRR